MNKEDLIILIRSQLDRLELVCDSECNEKLEEMTMDQLLLLVRWLATQERKRDPRGQ
mgnify:CR=1 FL=1